MAGLKYGVFVGVMTVVFMRVMPQPLGAMIYWSLLALQGTSFAIVCWHRTRLPFATAALAGLAAISSCVFVLGAAGYPFPNLPEASWIPLGLGIVAAGILMWVESRVNADKWRVWRQRGDTASLWDVLLGRHIPRL